MTTGNRQAEWNSNFEQVKAFAANNKKWPSTTSKDNTEKSLGQWWSRQKYLLGKKADGEKSPGLSPERETLLKDFIEANASFEREGIWDARYQIVVDKFKADKKLWAYATEDAEEQKNIRWWNQQKTFARKFKIDPSKPFGGMTQERYAKITSLMRAMGTDLDNEGNEVTANSAANTST